MYFSGRRALTIRFKILRPVISFLTIGFTIDSVSILVTVIDKNVAKTNTNFLPDRDKY